MIKIDKEQRQKNIECIDDEVNKKPSMLLKIKNTIIESYNSGDKNINIRVKFDGSVCIKNQCYDYDQPAKKIINRDLNNAPDSIKDLFADVSINDIIKTYTFRLVYCAIPSGRDYEYCLIFK